MARALVKIASAPTSQIWVRDGNGYGSTNTRIRRYSNATTIGTAISYVDDAGLGGYFTINEAGVYSMSLTDARSGAAVISGISLNSSQLSTNIQSITQADRIAYIQGGTALVHSVSVTRRLAVGDIIRSHDAQSADATTLATFTITQVAKV